MDVPAETRFMPQGGFIPSQPRSLGTPLPTGKQGTRLGPARPVGWSWGEASSRARSPASPMVCGCPGSVGEPGGLGKTGQGFVFWGVLSRWRKRGRGGAGTRKFRRGTARPRSGCRPPRSQQGEGPSCMCCSAGMEMGAQHPGLGAWHHCPSLLGEGR